MPFECKGCGREVKCVIDGYCIHCNPNKDLELKKNDTNDKNSNPRADKEDS